MYRSHLLSFEFCHFNLKSRHSSLKTCFLLLYSVVLEWFKHGREYILIHSALLYVICNCTNQYRKFTQTIYRAVKSQKSFLNKKQAHVGMEPSETNQIRHFNFHTIPTSCVISLRFALLGNYAGIIHQSLLIDS